MQIVYLSKLCATKDLTTKICFSPCLSRNALKKRIEVCLWKPTYVQLSTRGRLDSWLIWGWGTRRMSYTMNFPPPSLHLLETAKHKTRPTTKWEAEQMKTSLLPDALQVHMFMTQVQWSMQPMHVTIAVPFILAETPSWPGTLVRTWKSTCPRLSCLLLQSCWHTCHFIQIQHLTHLQKLICLKILHVLKWSQLTTRCYRRLCMANIS